MTDLSQWDVAEHFTPCEAAALMSGCDPRADVGGNPFSSRIGDAMVKTFVAVARGEPLPPDGLLTRELELTMHPDFVPSIFLDKTGSTLHGIETIDRAEIVRWLAAIDAKSAYQFAPAQSPATPAPVVAVEPASNGPAKPTATVDRGWVMKRAALIKKHERQWLTISRDLQDASDNDLSKAAKASGHGDWFEADALNWARQRGKLSEALDRPTPSPATPFTGLTHRTRG